MNCPICRRAEAAILLNGVGDRGPIAKLQCPYCGVFRIQEDLESGFPTIPPPIRFAVSSAARWANLEGSSEDGRVSSVLIRDEQDAIRLATDHPIPSDPTKQLDHLLGLVAQFAPGLAQQTPDHLTAEIWAALLGVQDVLALIAITDLAERERFLDPAVSNELTWALTLSGWKRVRESHGAIGKGKDAFVAMWFGEAMDRVWMEGFKPALTSLGWNPVRIDKVDFLGKIDDEILSRIRLSGLLIADITGARHGVYFEAGFAMGLSIPVVWTCNKGWQTRIQTETFANDIRVPETKVISWLEAAHFDTKMYPHLLWSDATDLHAQLVAKLRALALKPVRAVPHLR